MKTLRWAAMVWYLLLFLLLAGTALRSHAAPATSGEWKRMAVVVACPRGLDEDRDLRYALDDADRLHDVLSSIGEVGPQDLFLIKSQTAGELRKALRYAGRHASRLASEGRKVFLQFYYTGHGSGDGFHVGGEVIGFDEVRGLLNTSVLEAKVFVLDVCYGASFFNAKGLSPAPPLRIDLDLERSAKGEVTISSSAADEQAYEVKSLGGSVFTSHWLLALRGAADKNKDGQVALFEAYAYAYDRTVAYAAESLRRQQHPAYQMDIQGERDLTLTRPLQSPSGLEFLGCPPGKYTILDINRGLTVGELQLPSKGRFSLALEAGTYEVHHYPRDAPSRSALVELTRSSPTRLPYGDFRVVSSQVSGEGKGAELTGATNAPTQALARALPDPLRPTDASRTVASHNKSIHLGLHLDAGLASPLGGSWRDGFRESGLTGLFGLSEKPLRGQWGSEVRAQLSLAKGTSPWALHLSAGACNNQAFGSAQGLEILPFAPPEYAVMVETELALQNIELGVGLSRRVPFLGKASLLLDLQALSINRSITYTNSIERTLYGVEKVGEQNYTASGLGLRGSLMLVFPLTPGPGPALVCGGSVKALRMEAVLEDETGSNRSGETNEWGYTIRTGAQWDFKL